MAFDPKHLSDDVSVSGQILPEDLEAVKTAGFKSIINNRPDGEKPGQPEATDLEQMLQTMGIDVRHIPMTPGRLTQDLLDGIAAAYDELPKPILAFCASGTRSTMLWCCINAGTVGIDAVLESAQNAGYDLEQIRPLLTQLSP